MKKGVSISKLKYICIIQENMHFVIHLYADVNIGWWIERTFGDWKYHYIGFLMPLCLFQWPLIAQTHDFVNIEKLGKKHNYSLTAFLDPACIRLTWPMITLQTAPCKENGHLSERICGAWYISFFIHSVLSVIFLGTIKQLLGRGDIPVESIGQSKNKLPNNLILSSSQKVELFPPIHVRTIGYLLQS